MHNKRLFTIMLGTIYKFIFSVIITCFFWSSLPAQVLYIDCNNGNDNNPGTVEAPLFSIHKAAEIIKNADNDFTTMKINPGIYILKSLVSVVTDKQMYNKRIIIEANILPDDSLWTPDKMPVILSCAPKGEIFKEHNVGKLMIAGFLINENHVTIRGLKFSGHPYPNSVYYPIARFNKEKKDLIVEQCLFVADPQSAAIQVGILAHGDSIKVDHCIFYNVNNTVVYWEASKNDIKTGNSMTNCIIYGAFKSAIWTSWPDKDFIFKNNIVTNCNYFWNKYTVVNYTLYTIDSCVIVNNQHYTGNGEKPVKFPLTENNVIKKGEISLRLVNSVFDPIPIDHLHILPNTLGYNLHAGLFKHRKQ